MAPQAPPDMPPSIVRNNELTGEGIKVIVVTVVLSILATFSVIARLWSRHVNSSTWRPTVEDWLVVGALIFTWGYAAGNIVCMA